MGTKRTAEVLTPVTMLRQVIELDKYVSTLDIHRMDEEGLYNYISHILTDENIATVNSFNEIAVNTSIVHSIVKSSKSLSWKWARRVVERLQKLEVDESGKTAMTVFSQQSKNNHRWEKYKTIIILVAVIVICGLIYIVSK